jgi:hypothetical protein
MIYISNDFDSNLVQNDLFTKTEGVVYSRYSYVESNSRLRSRSIPSATRRSMWPPPVQPLYHWNLRGRQLRESLFSWLVADGWCWFVLREEYCWLVAGGWFVLREKYCCLVAEPNEQGAPCKCVRTAPGRHCISGRCMRNTIIGNTPTAAAGSKCQCELVYA